VEHGTGRKTVRLVDDLDGGEADESISFAFDGVALEIDLSNDNAEKVRGISLRAAARRGDGRRARRPQRMSMASTASREDAGPILADRT
jgi:hypothetical protein